ncbi:octopine transport system permease protein OccQ [Arthrobacter sp. Hiyo4]|nr:octopine transport system permease protein OccQ [Arthrobacter sp. Hiyo4]
MCGLAAGQEDHGSPGVGFIIGLVKDSSLVTVTGLVELTHAGNIVTNLTGDPIMTFLTVAAMYFVICYSVSLLGRLHEKRTGIQVDPSNFPSPRAFRSEYDCDSC